MSSRTRCEEESYTRDAHRIRFFAIAQEIVSPYGRNDNK
jgi:hypothetical protein